MSHLSRNWSLPVRFMLAFDAILLLTALAVSNFELRPIEIPVVLLSLAASSWVTFNLTRRLAVPFSRLSARLKTEMLVRSEVEQSAQEARQWAEKLAEVTTALSQATDELAILSAVRLA